MPRGRYSGIPGLQEDDYVVYRDHRGRFRADRIERAGRHTTLGLAAGTASEREAIRVTERDARTRGTFAGVVVRMRRDGSMTQIGSLDEGRYVPSG